MGSGLAQATIVRSLSPIIAKHCRVLVLGTLSGPESLARGEYYADSTNKFWPIIYSLFGNKKPHTSYEERLEFLLSTGIGIWDVVAEGIRPGSSDRKITVLRPNDFEALFEEYGGIAYIGFNGQAAARLFAKHVGLTLPRDRYILLPSTSGALAMPVEVKIELWRTVLECLLTHRNLL